MDVYRNDRVNPGLDLLTSTAKPDEVARFQLKIGDSVITKDSEDPSDIGISAFVDATSDDFVCGYHLAIIRPNSAVHPRYLNWSLRSRSVLDYWSSQASGMTRYGLGLDTIRSAPVNVVDLKEQSRIADFLDDRVARIDQILNARRKQIVYVKAIFRAAVGALLDATATAYPSAPLRRFCAGIEQGSSPVGEDQPAGQGEQGVLKTSAIASGTFVASQNKLIPPSAADERFAVREGDVVITRGSGSADLVGDAAVAKVSSYPGRLFLSDLTYRLRGLTLNSEYAVLALISPRGRAALGALIRQGSGPAKARGDDILSIPVPVAPRQHQQRVVAQASELLRAARQGQSQLHRSIALLTDYKVSLISAAVAGDIDVTTGGSGILG